MIPYADTNLLSRLYLRVSESELIKKRIEGVAELGGAPLPVTWLHRAETINALQLYVFEGKNPGQVRITSEQAAAAHATFKSDIAEGAFLRAAEIDFDELGAEFENLSLRHTAKHGFRSYDILHVASALILGCDCFWTFDTKARRLAALEGLSIG
jgi:predicted nucleic acid-binding protein